jgi:hypothetical protein
MCILGSSDCRAGMLTRSLDVPATLEGKSSPGGWGALVVMFDRPITGGTFTFQPKCPTPLNGNLNPADNTTIQLGPGGYGLGQTGTELTSPPLLATDPDLGKKYGKFDFKINFDGDTEPKIKSAFWQSKPVRSQVRRFDFIEGEDLRSVPEPSALCLALCSGGLMLLARRKLLVAR